MPNYIIHNKLYWTNKDIIVNYRRDASVIMKWANIFFELSIMFGIMSLSYPVFLNFFADKNSIYQQAEKLCQNYFMDNETDSSLNDEVPQRYLLQVLPENSNDIYDEIGYILKGFYWIRILAIIFVPLEFIISSYRIQFWHIWLILGNFIAYLVVTFNEVKNLNFYSKNCFLVNTYPGMLSFDGQDFLNILKIIISVIIIFISSWYVTFIIKKKVIFNPTQNEIAALNLFVSKNHLKNLDFSMERRLSVMSSRFEEEIR